MYIPNRLTLVASLAGCLLAGCTGHTATRATPVRSPASPVAVTTSKAALPDKTGIAACDDYLSSYLACHRAAAIYPADQLQARYEAMRTSLLRDSQNPAIRPHLADRCNSLSRLLREALHGKSCAENPAPVSQNP